MQFSLLSLSKLLWIGSNQLVSFLSTCNTYQERLMVGSVKLLLGEGLKPVPTRSVVRKLCQLLKYR